jgi:hypothetical protein
MVLYEIASGYEPFHDLDIQVAALHIARGNQHPLPSDIPLPYRRCIELCWSTRPMTRPKAIDIANQLHDYLISLPL